MQSENLNELNAALAKAQGAMKPAKFNRVNTFHKNEYADIGAIWEAARIPLSENGLSVTQTTGVLEGVFMLITTLRHASGQWVSSEHPLPPITAKPQEMGSAMTYARRYSFSAMVGIASEADDDSEAAQASKGNGHATAKPSQINPQPQEAPVHPETGEVSPHEIPYADNPVVWGRSYIAALKAAATAAEIAEWQTANMLAIETIRTHAPRAAASINAATAAELARIGS